MAMAKRAAKRAHQKSTYVVKQEAATGRYIIKESKTGKKFVLKGYASFRGAKSAKSRVDLTKPIYDQVKKSK